MSLKKLVQLHKLLALEPWKALQPATCLMNYTPKFPSRGCFFFSVFLHLVKFPVKVFTFGTKHQPVAITQAGTHQVSEQIWGGLHYPVRVNVANYFLFFHSQLHCSLQKQTVSCAACSLIVKRVLSRTIHVTLYFCITPCTVCYWMCSQLTLSLRVVLVLYMYVCAFVYPTVIALCAVYAVTVDKRTVHP